MEHMLREGKQTVHYNNQARQPLTIATERRKKDEPYDRNTYAVFSDMKYPLTRHHCSDHPAPWRIAPGTNCPSSDDRILFGGSSNDKDDGSYAG